MLHNDKLIGVALEVINIANSDYGLEIKTQRVEEALMQQVPLLIEHPDAKLNGAYIAEIQNGFISNFVISIPSNFSLHSNDPTAIPARMLVMASGNKYVFRQHSYEDLQLTKYLSFIRELIDAEQYKTDYNRENRKSI